MNIASPLGSATPRCRPFGGGAIRVKRSRFCSQVIWSVIAALAGMTPAWGEDHGVVQLTCKGSAQDNDDPHGRDERVKTTDKQGRLTIDFDAQQIDFLQWTHIPISDLSYARIQADRNAFENGSGYHVHIDRVSGEVSFQMLIHDAKTGDTWFSHTFAGRCAKADKQGHSGKAKGDSGGF